MTLMCPPWGATELDRDDFGGRHVKLFGRKGVHEFRGVVA